MDVKRRRYFPGYLLRRWDILFSDVHENLLQTSSIPWITVLQCDFQRVLGCRARWDVNQTVKHEMWKVWKEDVIERTEEEKPCLAKQKPNLMLLPYRRLTERLCIGFFQAKHRPEPSLSLAGVR